MAYSLDALFSKVLKASIMNNDEEGNYSQKIGMEISGYAYQIPCKFP